MFKLIFIFLSLFLSLSAKDFTVASYNVENLFDLKKQGTEYKEYIPYTKYWNQKSYNIKLQNISKTINDLDSDIIALQEIESSVALEELLKLTPKYKYSKFLKNRKSSIGVAILSIYPIIKTKRVVVDRWDKYSRDILKATIEIENKSLIIYVNHWRSKRAKESKRIIYATALKNELDSLSDFKDYIILGDLNSNYDEFLTFKYDRKLNDTYGITGINQVLNTTIKENFITKENILTFTKLVNYNLWLDLKKHNRFSSRYKGNSDTPDNMIVSKGLFDNENISYKYNSFNVFKPNYLYKNKKIVRWNKYKFRGYSDHLPIYATFSTSKQEKVIKNKIKEHIVSKISQLYKIQQINEPINLKDVVVIYKSKKIVIVKQLNQRSIMIYNPPLNMEVGYKYDITVDKIDEYNGLKEIKELSFVENKVKYKNYKSLYSNANSIDLFDEKNQNEIITNLKGTYKKGYLYYSKNGKISKIKLYFKNKQHKPQNGKTIVIKTGHLSIYKSKIQIVIYKKNDFI
ncbi:MAG: endonuclease [Campylobacterota bacterium]|nr:endonuclease [Campylobacterota bacterium]